MFGRATIWLSIGPHSSYECNVVQYGETDRSDVDVLLTTKMLLIESNFMLMNLVKG